MGKNQTQNMREKQSRKKAKADKKMEITFGEKMKKILSERKIKINERIGRGKKSQVRIEHTENDEEEKTEKKLNKRKKRKRSEKGNEHIEVSKGSKTKREKDNKKAQGKKKCQSEEQKKK